MHFGSRRLTIRPEGLRWLHERSAADRDGSSARQVDLDGGRRGRSSRVPRTGPVAGRRCLPALRLAAGSASSRRGRSTSAASAPTSSAPRPARCFMTRISRSRNGCLRSRSCWSRAVATRRTGFRTFSAAATRAPGSSSIGSGPRWRMPCSARAPSCKATSVDGRLRHEPAEEARARGRRARARADPRRPSPDQAASLGRLPPP